MAYFPLFVDLEGQQVLVVGGGKIAVRRGADAFGVQVPDHCCISGSVRRLREKVLWKKKR